MGELPGFDPTKDRKEHTPTGKGRRTRGVAFSSPGAAFAMMNLAENILKDGEATIRIGKDEVVLTRENVPQDLRDLVSETSAPPSREDEQLPSPAQEIDSGAASALSMMLIEDRLRKGGKISFPSLGIVLGPEVLPAPKKDSE